MWIFGEFVQEKDRKQQSRQAGNILAMPQGAKITSVVLLTLNLNSSPSPSSF